MEKIKLKVQTLLKTGFFHVFGSNVINKIIGFMSSMVLVRILSKTEYGAFTYAWNIYCIIALFNGMGVESGTLQLASEHSGDKDYARQISDYGTRVGLVFNVGLSLATFGIGLFAPLTINGAKVLVCSMFAMPFFQFLYNMYSTYLRSQKMNKEYSQMSVTNTAILFIASALFAFLFREMGLIIGHYTAYIVACLMGAIYYRIHLLNRDRHDLGEDKKILLKISLISMMNNGLSQLMYLIDVFVIGIVAPEETILASYKVATMIPTALAFIPTSLIVYVYPYFAEHKDDGKWCINRYKQILFGLGGANALISAVLWLFAPLIVRILYGTQYLDSVPVFRVLALSYFFSGTFRTISGNLLVTQRKLRFNLFVAVISSAVNIVADYYFIQWWGSMGAAYATVLVIMITSIMSTAYLIKTFRSKC